ncbi:dTDP-fucosamine acetyltransferase [Candidatus Burarchaeum australiense]|nr:dTDP-fucosamine acetyltransferase [Candidatus Burarchaeum australiense]
MGFLVRRMRATDIPAIAGLSEKYFPLARIDEGEVRRRTSGGVAYLVAEEDGQVVGFVGGKLRGRDGRISGIAVSPAYERRGIGSALLERATAFARENGRGSLSLLVKEYNVKAVRFYTSHGFSLKAAKPGKDGGVLLLWRGIEN